jgi:hypothetical protein
MVSSLDAHDREPAQAAQVCRGMRVEDYKWLFLDLNSYFASVEQQERPELRGRPVAIVPMETDYTMAIAASPEAKAYGVKTGTGILEVKRDRPAHDASEYWNESTS